MEISGHPRQPADNLTFHIPDSHESAPVVFSFKIRRAIFGNVWDFLGHVMKTTLFWVNMEENQCVLQQTDY